jgi:thiamine-phosphate pyrophosphorylase
MYERFTDKARRAMQLANQEAQRFNHEYVGTEHVLLGLMHGENLAANVIKSFGIDLRTVRVEVEKLVLSGPEMVTMGKLPLTPRVKKALEYAAKEARELGHNYVGTEHMLLGLLHEEEGVAGQVLRNLDIGVLQTRKKILDLLDFSGVQDDSAAGVKPNVVMLGGSLTHAADASTAVYRILDASANRAAEGLRVVEDYLRFVLDDPLLTDEAKSLRHDLAAAVARFDRAALVAARDIPGDVGTDIKTATEFDRENAEHVLAANLHRAAQALRSLGEYAKVIAPEVAPRFETIRYQVYHLESTLASRQAGMKRFAGVRLYVLVDGKKSREEFLAFIDALLSAGVHVIQLRDKQLNDRELVSRGQDLRDRITQHKSPAIFIMNDRPDLALLCDADGVHVGQEELAVAEVRKIIGPRKLVGVSTHSLEQARAAVLDGANYIGVGPTFPSSTKEFADFPGVQLLSEVASTIRLPAFAIGGITLENVEQVLATGIHRVAVSGAIASAGDPAEAVHQWLARVQTKTP